MVLVVLGTWDMPFTRPLIELEAAASAGCFHEPIVVQCGNTVYPSRSFTLVPFFEEIELNRLYDEASLIICQAGVGSIMMGLKKHKKVIAIARLAKYDEHIDDHQLEILDVFAKSGSILAWRGTGDLVEVLQRSVDFVPTGYPFGHERISAAILTYLEKGRN